MQAFRSPQTPGQPRMTRITPPPAPLAPAGPSAPSPGAWQQAVARSPAAPGAGQAGGPDPHLMPVDFRTQRGYPAPFNPLGVFIPGSPENNAWVSSTMRALDAAGQAIGGLFGGPQVLNAEAAPQPMPPLPADPDDLLDQGWREESHPDAAESGRRTFTHPETGQQIEFDRGRPGVPGHRGHDHYHVHNPNATGQGDAYLDRNGRPVPRGSGPSHIRPDGQP